MNQSLNQLIVDLARWVTLGVLGWLAVSVALSVAVAVAAEAGRMGPRWVRRAAATVSPVVIRLSVRTVVRTAVRLGCVLAATAPVGLATHPALADQPAAGHTRPGPALPVPDRPHVGPGSPTGLAGRAQGSPVGTAVAAAAVAGPEGLVVRPGDSLWVITAEHLPPGAEAAAIAACWPKWYAANRDRIGPDPDLIHPGTHLRQPEPGCSPSP